MFTNEARIAMGLLSHGNIAQVFDFGEIDGDYFLAMELVDGQPLSKVLKRARTRRAFAALPVAVRAASSRSRCSRACTTRTPASTSDGQPLKIVHRDVSPAERAHQLRGPGEDRRLRHREGARLRAATRPRRAR